MFQYFYCTINVDSGRHSGGRGTTSLLDNFFDMHHHYSDAPAATTKCKVSSLPFGVPKIA